MLNKTAHSKNLVVFSLASVALLLLNASASAQCACGGAASGGYSLTMGMPGLPMDGSVGQILEANAIYLTVNVPEKAILKVNGDPTISLGTTRYFVIKELDPKHEYKFVIVAETANAAGVAMEETKTVKLKVGAMETVTLKPVKRKVIPPVVVADDAAAEEPEEAEKAEADASVAQARNNSRTGVR